MPLIKINKDPNYNKNDIIWMNIIKKAINAIFFFSFFYS